MGMGIQPIDFGEVRSLDFSCVVARAELGKSQTTYLTSIYDIIGGSSNVVLSTDAGKAQKRPIHSLSLVNRSEPNMINKYYVIMDIIYI
jgi:hypothetical protein